MMTIVMETFCWGRVRRIICASLGSPGLPGGRWQVAGGRWQVAGGRWQRLVDNDNF